MNISEEPITEILKLFPSAKPLGKGGQKVVFQIEHKKYGICVLKIGIYQSKSSLERILREVEILKSLSTPYYPTHFEFTIVEPNMFYSIEEYLEGPTLGEVLGSFDNEESIIIFASHIIKALSFLWERRIVHRDIKPQNIIMSKEHPKIIDLGIVRLLDAESLTQTYAPSGPCTSYYASPEQLENRKRDIDVRTDQFALGIVLGQIILRGAHPFSPAIVGGESVPDNILRGNWARIEIKKTVSPQTSAFIEKLLGREPYMRFRFPSEVFDAIHSIGGI